MEIKIGKHILSDWEKWISSDVRAIYTGDENITELNGSYSILGPIGRPQVRLLYNRNYEWFPIFSNQLECMQKIYDNEILNKNIDFSNQEKTKLYIDNFLIKYINRVNKLITFS